MVAAQHMESQVALYLIVSLPSPRDGLLSSFFPLCFSFASSYILNVFLLFAFVLSSPCRLTLHTSVSILLLICCICKTHANLEKKRSQVNLI